MCGIAALFGPSNTLCHDIRTMCNTLRHRGPDDEGIAVQVANGNVLSCFTEQSQEALKRTENQLNLKPFEVVLNQPTGSFALGHRRLSIIDLSALGHQPMSDESGHYWLIFNGEIYNYKALRTSLESIEGVKFRSQSDSEVLLYALIHRGQAIIPKLNGMFAFIFVDLKKHQALIARDRAGVKPLYLAKSNGGQWAFASEQKAIHALKWPQIQPNHYAIAQYLGQNAIETETHQNFFDNISEIPNNTIWVLNLKTNTLQKSGYITDTLTNQRAPNPSEANFKKEFDRYAEELKALLTESVKLRMRTDVPLGSCLSGGIDSSAIVCLMHTLLPPDSPNLKVFTAASNNALFDERQWAKYVVDKTNADWKSVLPTALECQQDLPDLIYSQDTPSLTLQTYAQWRVMKLASQNNVKVILDGQGSDELFAGYPIHQVAYLNGLLANGNLGTFNNALFKTSSMVAVTPWKYWLKTNVKHGLREHLPLPTNKHISQHLYPEWQFLSPKFKQENTKGLGHMPPAHLANLNERLNFEFYGGSLKHMLRCEDRCSMWHSIESRTPFADDINLIDFAQKIPISLLMYRGSRKQLLRDSLKSVLPEPIYNRKDKMGFNAPTNPWIAGIRQHFKHLFEKQDDILDTQQILKHYDTYFNPENPIENGRIFKFLGYMIWKNNFFGQQ